jgi:hypothetical protein
VRTMVICLVLLVLAAALFPLLGKAAQDGTVASATGWVPFYGTGPVGSKTAHILDMYALPDLGTVYMSFWVYDDAADTWSRLKPKPALGDSIFPLREGLPVRFIFEPNAPDAVYLSGDGRADLMWE